MSSSTATTASAQSVSQAVIRLGLMNFRSYARADLSCGDGWVVLSGPNGAGKTNLLEAVSLLVPGRGLRQAKLSEITHRADGVPALPEGNIAWAVSAELLRGEEAHRLGTGCEVTAAEDESNNGVKERRVVRIDGENANQVSLGRLLSVIWLTPQMDRLFLEGRTARRRFFDRLVYGLDPDHLGRLNAYDHAQRERAKLLREGIADDVWLSALEATMSEKGVAIAAARRDVLARLLGAKETAAPEAFPGARINLIGDLEEWLEGTAAADVEARFQETLRNNRLLDGAQGGAATGPHRSDIAVEHVDKALPADQCSTGEQKALLISIVLASAALQALERGFPPILLLDEVAAHLDERRRDALFGHLKHLGAQVWLTGTERELFGRLEGEAAFFELENSTIGPA